MERLHFRLHRLLTLNSSLLTFCKGFVYAFRGIMTCMKEERNFRFHLAAAFHLFAYMPFFELSRAEAGILVVLCGLVISLEAVNSAIERAIDSTGIVSPTAGASKDIAAGAVLIAAVTAVAVGIILLWQPHAFLAIGRFFMRYPLAVIIQLAVLAVWIWFIFFWRSGDQK